MMKQPINFLETFFIFMMTFVFVLMATPISVMADDTEPLQSRRSLSDLQVVIDPGHGGHDPGAVAMHGGVLARESDIVLDVSLRLQRLLNQTGMQIGMTRTDDTFVTLMGRSDYANRRGADIFVSVHTNAATNSAANGIETYHFGPQTGRNDSSIHHGFNNLEMIQERNSTRAQESLLLAQAIQARLLEQLQLNDRGVRQGNFSVIRETNMAAVLAELGFLTNDGDRERLMSDYWRDRAAAGLYLGILDYLVIQGYNVPAQLFTVVDGGPPPTIDGGGGGSSPNDEARQGRTTANLNVRTGNSTAHSIVTTLPNGTNVTILEERNGWFRIQSGNTTGWVTTQFVQIISGGVTPTPETRTGRTTANLNVRSGNSTAHNIITTLPNRTNVTILEERSGWFRIQSGNATGWVSAEFVQIISGGATPPPPPPPGDNNNTGNESRTGRTTANLNVRSGNSTAHNIITTLPNRTNVTILEERNGWFRIQSGNTTGWVSAEFVQITSGGSGNNNNNNTGTTTRTGRTIANLNVRTGNSTSHNIVRTLPNGTNLTILEERNGWFRIQSGNTTGWVSAEFVQITSGGSDNNTTTPASRTGNTTANLNVRTGNSTSHSIVRTLPNGTTLTILEERGGWFRIQSGNTTGWVSKEFVRVH